MSAKTDHSHLVVIRVYCIAEDSVLAANLVTVLNEERISTQPIGQRREDSQRSYEH